jgi:hypothetical protein
MAKTANSVKKTATEVATVSTFRGVITQYIRTDVKNKDCKDCTVVYATHSAETGKPITFCVKYNTESFEFKKAIESLEIMQTSVQPLPKEEQYKVKIRDIEGYVKEYPVEFKIINILTPRQLKIAEILDADFENQKVKA